jgi:hypothetical protein
LHRFASPLDGVRVAAPCAADWTEMTGSERVRFCARCEQHVYNLSALTKREAERLVMNKEDRLCVRFYRRADGTILTRNCPVGLRALKRRASSLAGAVFATATTFLIAVGVVAPSQQREPVPSPAPVVEYTECMGGCSRVFSPYGEQIAAGGLLGSVVFLFGYPLLKLKERHEAKQREALHIWQK